MNRTFAARAKSIQNKYKFADRDPVQRESMYDELQQLADEQEALKQSMGVQSEGNQFAPGGWLDPGPKKTPNFSNFNFNEVMGLPEINPSTKGDGMNSFQFQAGIDIPEFSLSKFTSSDPLVKTWSPGETIGEKGARLFPLNSVTEGGGMANKSSFWDKLKGDFKENPENYFNALSGAAAIGTNYANYKSIEMPDKITPQMYNPSIKPTFFDSAAIEAGIDNQFSTAAYGLTNKSSDINNYLAGLKQLQSAAGEGLSTAMLEGQKLNMGEQGRIDALVSDSMKFNTENMNAADIDWEQRKDNARQLKRDYRAGIGDAAGGIFKDIADSKLALKLGSMYELMAKINGVKTNENK